MMAASSIAKKTIAFIFSDETHVRRNRTREKLRALGFEIKKEFSAASRAYDFSTVDLVVMMAEGSQLNKPPVEAACVRDDVEIVHIEHQSTRGGWDRLRSMMAVDAPSLSLVPAAPASMVQSREERRQARDDEDAGALYAVLEDERDEARGDCAKARADRERLEKEVAELHGKALKLETALESTKLGNGEVQAQRAAWNTTLLAAHDQNAKLLRERDAAREALTRRENVAGWLERAKADLVETTEARDTYMQKHRDASARVSDLSVELDAVKAQLTYRGEAAVVKKLREDYSEVARRNVDVRCEWEAAQKEIATLRAKLESAPTVPPPPSNDLAEAAAALRTLVKQKILTADEAFAKLVEAAS